MIVSNQFLFPNSGGSSFYIFHVNSDLVVSWKMYFSANSSSTLFFLSHRDSFKSSDLASVLEARLIQSNKRNSLEIPTIICDL